LLIAVIALVVGVFGALDAFKKLPEAKQPPVVKVQETEKYVSAWRALRPLRKGSPISPDAVSKVQLPLSEALTHGMRGDIDIEFSPSTLLSRHVSQGDYILPEFQLSEGESGYIDLLISEGMTLYPLQVSVKNLINDYIRPGSYIDILTVSSPRDNLSGSVDKPKNFRGVRASMFLKHIKVLNIGDDKGAVVARSPSQDKGLTTIVIEVQPDDLPRLALAQRTMHIEIYRSQTYTKPTEAEVRNVIDNYMGIEEFRGKSTSLREAM
jgi:pilus assembly protein CpaB